MPELQYYSVEPQAPLPWWQRKRVWQMVGIATLTAAVLIVIVVGITNLVRQRSLESDKGSALVEAQELAATLAADCEDNDTACLAEARQRAARTSGNARVCEGLAGEQLQTCVTLVAQDEYDPEACKLLAGDDQTSCYDSAYLLKARQDIDLELCSKITAQDLRFGCATQVKNVIVLSGTCAENNVDTALCEEYAALRTAIESGTTSACEALQVEVDRESCFESLDSTDEDGDGLALGDEGALGLSDTNPDTDGDGLTDGEEVGEYKTDPTKSDTDGDGFTDGTEVAGGYDPLM